MKWEKHGQIFCKPESDGSAWYTFLARVAVCIKQGNLITRTTSCYCTGCLTETEFCDGWQQHTNQFNDVTNQANMRMADISVDKFVAAVYQDDLYMYTGKICAIDHQGQRN